MQKNHTTISDFSPSGTLARPDGHRIAYTLSGPRTAPAALVLHGGPGSGSSPGLALPFAPGRWRIVQFDQRGCGASTPLGRVEDNCTAALLDDIEALRRHLGVRAWLVAGGSWGAALALAYAAHAPGCVRGLLLRNVFLTDRAEIQAFFDQARARGVGPPPLPGASGHVDTARVLDRFFASAATPQAHWKAVQWLARCDAVLSGTGQAASADITAPPVGSQAARQWSAKYRIQMHYLAHACFLGPERLLAAAAAVSAAGIPAALVHGCADPICAPENARRVHRVLAGSRLALIPGAGHDPFHPGVLEATRASLRWLRACQPGSGGA